MFKVYIVYCRQLHTTHFRQGNLVFKSTRTISLHSTLAVHQKPQHPASTKLTDCKHLQCKKSQKSNVMVYSNFTKK